MGEKYIDIYSILSDVDRLSKYEYDDLVSIYGSELVNLVIEDLINEDEDNIYRFNIKSEEVSNLDKINGLSSGHLYKSDVNMISCLDSDKNLVLMNQVADIIRELQDMFSLLGCDDSILGKGKTPWIEDKVNYCIEYCNDSATLDRLKYLFNQYDSVRNIIVKGNLKLVMSIASQYKVDNSTSFLEIVQNGNIGLMYAVEKYDFSKETAFSTYATICIRKRIEGNLKNLKYPMRVTQYRSYSYRRILTAINDLSMQLGRMATNKEIAEYMEKSVSWIEKTMAIFSSTLALDELVEMDDECCTYSDLIEDKNADIYGIIYNDYLSKELREILEDNLTEKQLFVIMHHFGFCGKCYSMPEIASILGVSNSNVHRLKKNAIKRLCDKTNIMELATD